MESNPLHTQKWKVADQLAQKSGQRRCVLSVSGSQYTGEWENNKRDGNIYSGGWCKDMKEGKGSFLYKAKNQRYDGEWINNIAKCGILVDCPGDDNSNGTKLPICHLIDADRVLQEQSRTLAKSIQREEDLISGSDM